MREIILIIFSAFAIGSIIGAQVGARNVFNDLEATLDTCMVYGDQRTEWETWKVEDFQQRCWEDMQ